MRARGSRVIAVRAWRAYITARRSVDGSSTLPHTVSDSVAPADDEHKPHLDRRSRAKSRLAELNPIRFYERCEAAAALMSVSSTMPGDPYRMLQRFPDIWRWRANP